MPNALNYDSRDDYLDACMGAQDKIVQAITDREELVDAYVEWMIDTRPETLAELLIDTAEAHDSLQAFAKVHIAAEAENRADARAQDSGLDL